MQYPTHLKEFRIQDELIEIFVPQQQAVQQSYRQGITGSPYWSQVWPAAIALADILIRNPTWIHQKKVMELAAGLGLPSIVAAAFATSVLCTDIEPEVLQIAQASAAHKNLKNVQTAVADWNTVSISTDTEVLLLSDINYDPSAFAALNAIIRKVLYHGTLILLSTPQRLMAKEFITPLLRYCRHSEEVPVVHGEKEVRISVFVLQEKKGWLQ